MGVKEAVFSLNSLKMLDRNATRMLNVGTVFYEKITVTPSFSYYPIGRVLLYSVFQKMPAGYRLVSLRLSRFIENHLQLMKM